MRSASVPASFSMSVATRRYRLACGIDELLHFTLELRKVTERVPDDSLIKLSEGVFGTLQY